MKRLYTLLALLFSTLLSQAQIGGGWDWAFNTGSLGPTMKMMKYQPNGDLLFAGQTNAAAYFGATNLSAPPQSNFPGTIYFLGKVAAGANSPTIVRSFSNALFTMDRITTDAAGNFYISGAISTPNPVDLGNGVTMSGNLQNYVAKLNASGVAQWAKVFGYGPTVGSLNQTYRIQVVASGSIYLLTRNTSAQNWNLQKLNSSGDQQWLIQSPFNTSVGGFDENNYSTSDQFIDNNENVHVFAYGTSRGIRVGADTATAPLAVTGPVVYSHHISVSAAGTLRFIKSYVGSIVQQTVSATTGQIALSYVQYQANGFAMASLPLSGANPSIPALYTGIVVLNNNGDYVKQSATLLGNGGYGQVAAMTWLANGGLAMHSLFAAGTLYSTGMDYLFATDPNTVAPALVETDANLVPVRQVATAKSAAGSAGMFCTNGNGIYAMAAIFQSSITVAMLPTTTVGNQSFTGFNAAPNLTTAYGIYSTSPGLRTDMIVCQSNSANWPLVATTTWLGLTNNWNSPTNWSNGVPSDSVKAIFNSGAANYPSVFTAPRAGLLQVNAGTILGLPATTVVPGGLQIDGTLQVAASGLFQGFGARRIMGTGTLDITGANSVLFMANSPECGLKLNGAASTFYNLSPRRLELNGATAKLDLGGKTIHITDPSPTALSTNNAANNVYGGLLRRSVAAGNTYSFPMGTASSVSTATLALTNGNAGGTLQASFTSGAPTGPAPNTTINGVSVNEVLNGGLFTIDPAPGGTANYNANLTLSGSTNTVADAGRYGLLKRDNATSNWAAPGQHLPATISGTTVTATQHNLSGFSQFAIGKSAASLPVTLAAFRAEATLSGDALLQWKTLSEHNNRGFAVQHSSNGTAWEAVGFVPAKGSNSSYQFIHVQPAAGLHFYRLQQQDFDGRTMLSEVQRINISRGKHPLTVYPNPAKGMVTLSQPFANGTNAVLYNQEGKMVAQMQVQQNRLLLPATLTSGQYTLRLLPTSTGTVLSATVFID